MRLLFFAVGSRGDVQPLLALAVRAKAEGHTAAVCAAPNFRELIEERGIEFRPLAIDVHAFMHANAGDLGTQGTWRTLQRTNAAIDEHLRDHFDSLTRYSHDADVIIGGGLCFAGPSVAERAGIPFRLVVYCPTGILSREHAPLFLPWQNLPRPLNRVLWSVLGALYHRLIGRPINQWRIAAGLAPMRHLLDNIYGERLLLACDAQLAPAPRDARPAIVRGQHDDLEAMVSLDERTEAFLRAGDKPIFIGFGSMPDENAARTTAILLEAVRLAGVRAILSRGWAGLGAGVSERNIFLLDEAPHALLFKRVAAVVHHGGSGTTHTAARAGVPQVVVIHLMDQNYWAARVEALGLGPRALQRKKLNAETLARAIRDAPQYTEAAARFAQSMPLPPSFSTLARELSLETQ